MEQIKPPGDDIDLALPARAGDTPTGVRRVNNMPLLIIGGVLLVFVVLVALVAVKRGANEPADSETTASLPDANPALDQMLANGALAGLVADADESGLPSFPVARVADPDAPPLPTREDGTPIPAGTVDDALSQERMKMFQTAMHAKTGITSRSSTPPAKADTGDGDERAAAAEPGEVDTRVPVHAEGDYSAYDGAKARKEGADRWLLGTTVEAPRTTFELRAGSVIPATMISGINSELPGQIVAQVSQDVFDTATGRHRLLPQGSRLVGRYNHNVIDGQSRVLVAWQRVVFPDGKALDIGAMEGVDAGGYAGFQDQVDRHYLRMFGSAILMSGITAGLTSSKIGPEVDPYGSSNSVLLSQNLAQQIGNVASQMIQKNMSYAPTLKIRPGYRFNVMAVKDLTFDHAYRPFDY